MWEPYKKGFKAYLQLERSLSDNSVEAYMRDIEKLTQYLEHSGTLKKSLGSKTNRPAKFYQMDRGTWHFAGFAGAYNIRRKIILQVLPDRTY